MMFVLVMLAVVACLLVATELPFRLGRARSRKLGEDRVKDHEYVAMRELVATVQVATLGLLALMLGFTMAMAESRFNQRRVINMDEANAVTTTFLRASLLPEPERARGRTLLHQYVRERVAYQRAATTEDAEAASSRAEAVSSQLWSDAAAVGQAHPDWDMVMAYVESLNEMIDYEATRDFSNRSHLPLLIPIVLVLIAIAAISVTGYATGLAGARSAFALYVVPLLVAVTCVMIIDLDHTRWGFIKVSGLPMDRAKQMIERELGVASAAR